MYSQGNSVVLTRSKDFFLQAITFRVYQSKISLINVFRKDSWYFANQFCSACLYAKVVAAWRTSDLNIWLFERLASESSWWVLFLAHSFSMCETILCCLFVVWQLRTHVVFFLRWSHLIYLDFVQRRRLNSFSSRKWEKLVITNFHFSWMNERRFCRRTMQIIF